MDPAAYWPRKLTTRKGTKEILRSHPIHFDFDPVALYKKDEARFPGIWTVRDFVDLHVKDNDWSKVVIILTDDDAVTVRYEEKENAKFFVLNANLLRNRHRTALSSLLGAAVSATPDLLQFASPERMRAALLNIDTAKILGGASLTDAHALLPVALSLLVESLAATAPDDVIPAEDVGPSSAGTAHEGTTSGSQEDVNSFDMPPSNDFGADVEASPMSSSAGLSPPPVQGVIVPSPVDVEVVSRIVSLLLARTRNREDVVAVLTALDAVPEVKREYFRRNPDIVRVVAERDITTDEIVGWAFRKAELAVYRDLMDGGAAIEAYRDAHGILQEGEEAVWQHFFEKNRWIFGLALDHFFNAAVSPERLEQYTTGHTFNQNGKRPDAFLASCGIIRSLCFVEIKTPRKDLMGTCYRGDVWPPSEELSGAVAQSQKTVYRALRSLQERFRLQDDEGAESGDPIFSVQPRALVVIGTLNEFLTDSGEIRQRPFTSFELFRRNLTYPEVLTFDELYVRAERIVESNLGRIT